jgi:Spy/CpxP family protein refolding chaperone
MQRNSWLYLAGLVVVAACSTDTTAPAATNLLAEDGIDLVQDLGVSSASVVDRGGIGGSEFPDSLRLTAEQKAQIAALHLGYQAATKADLEALQALEAEAKAARKAGKSRAEVEAILRKAEPVVARLRAAFAKLQEEIKRVYTPAQVAWLARRGEGCSRDSTARLTQDQIEKIRALKAAFEASIKDELALIRSVHQEAKEARAAGASEEQIKRILAKANDALEAIRKAEIRLKEAINAVLTEEQRRNHCILRGLNG